ncbi:alpha/beta fold hydrolase [Flexivirga alba]|uniref:prolyl aminopeptidase n=1 Tax=Flexivirga alba TaxID=702742 RepID=A0ABW2AHB3_9MICO
MDHRFIAARDGVSLQVAATVDGPDVVVLSGGPGCVHYLADESLAPRGFRAWFPDPRGVGRSGGGGHDLATAIADVEDIRRELGLETWLVLGHSWGSDLAVRYALDHPDRVSGVVGVAGRGLQYDRFWSAEYERLQHTEDVFDIDFVPEVHEALKASFRGWIHEPELFRALADSPVPMRFVAAAEDIRPSWPLRQLAELVPSARFSEVPGVVHNFWSTDPPVWVATVTAACAELTRAVAAQGAKG